MYTSLDQFMADLPRMAEAQKSRLAGHDITAVLETKQGRRLCFQLKDGELLMPESIDKPDCTVTADEQVLLDLINGKLNPMKAVMLRRVVIHGDINKLISMIGLL